MQLTTRSLEKGKQRPESNEPVKVYVEGHEIEITGDPANGI